MVGSLHLNAADFSVEYTGELQTSFKKSNFLNLLHLSTEIPFSKSLTFQATTISVAKSREEQIIHDLQTFSNIEEDNLPLAPAVCGLGWKIGDSHDLFFGVRNMNEDYFTSPVTSFFSNSSCGVYPTVSANYPIANYPVASLGVHYSYDSESMNFQTSLYNGVGYGHFGGRESVFRFSPKSDGVSSISQVEYRRKGSSYFCGNSLLFSRGVGVTPWLYVEQRAGNCEILAGYSHSFSKNAVCKDFMGMGFKAGREKHSLGVFVDYARYAGVGELASEATYKYRVSRMFCLQPAVHFIKPTGRKPTTRSEPPAEAHRFRAVACFRVVLTV